MTVYKIEELRGATPRLAEALHPAALRDRKSVV